LGFFSTVAQNFSKTEIPVLFTDRDYCISGDTVWFKVWHPKISELSGNIVRVQLDSYNNNLISEVAVRCNDSWAQGYIYVPDSLSTGQYFLTAFLKNSNFTDLELENKSLLVYNRFAEDISQLEIVQPNNTEQNIQNSTAFSLSTNKKEYHTRERVDIKININPGFDISNIIVKATLTDPLASEIKGKYKFEMQNSNLHIPDFIESDGILLSGKVTDINGIAQSDALVILSIGGTQPYFDYYVLGENGDFHFFLKDAFGSTDVVLQVVSNSIKQYHIQLENNNLVRKESGQLQNEILNQEQVDFINTAINAKFAQKLFNPSLHVQPVNCEIPARFSSPFYGPPTDHVIPDEFIDLPDFQEISREILPGLQYRLKNEEVTFRLINISYRIFFEEEPLRLINGIPVFKNDLFVNLKSTDISYIDIVKSERIYGDLVFKGVLSVSLYDKSNSWLAQQPNIFEFNVNFLQPDLKPGYMNDLNINPTHPDMRQTCFWDILNTNFLNNVEFTLSGRKGKVEITVEGFTGDNEFFKTSTTIEVK
jgi:hypothetical protein